MSKRKQYPSQARLRELFDYDPDGFLVWKYRPEMSKKWNSKYAGSRAGSSYFEASGGYRSRIGINEKSYNAMRLIWIYHNGCIPEGAYVKSSGDIFRGLRIEDMTLSSSKSKTHAGKRISSNVTGYLGVRRQSNGYYQAVRGDKRQGLGTYETAEAAASAYDVWARGHYGEGFVGNNSGCSNPEKLRVNKSERPVLKTKMPHGFRGVCSNPRYPKSSQKPYRAIFTVCSKQVLNRVFETKEQAARAYNIAAYEHYGEHAVLNDIPDPLGKGDIF